MSVELGRLPEPVGWVGNRNFIVPPDIIPVRRISPLPRKKRTLCRPRPEGEPICRSGNREWFSDQLFVDGQTRDLRVAHGSSVTAHASCLIGLLVLLAGQPAPTSPMRVSSPLRMPAFVAVSGLGGGGFASHLTLAAPERRGSAPPQGRIVKIEPPKKSPAAAAAPAPDPVAADPVPDSEPIPDATETPAVSEQGAHVGGADGVTGGAGDGAETHAGGHGDGTGSGGTGTTGMGGGSSGIGMSPGPYRLGKGIEPPRKIKDVAPVYPSGALASRALGTVLIEAVVGADGKVHDAKVVHSIPLLDRAALDAVRQWEFEPSRLNGAAVAVIVTVLVQFSIY